MTHADRMYTAPKELEDIRREFKPTIEHEAVVDGVTYVLAVRPSRATGVCTGCVAWDNTVLCGRLGPACLTGPSSAHTIFIKKERA